jgi:hypothetical protein
MKTTRSIFGERMSGSKLMKDLKNGNINSITIGYLA